jgi:hypothetical protein
MKQETLYITQNTPFIKDLAVKNSAGNPVNLTGYSASMFITKYFGSETKYSVNTVIQNAALGIIRVSISSTATLALPYGTMQYSIFITPSGGENNLMLQGQAVIIPTV